jgi:hypothetical protein
MTPGDLYRTCKVSANRLETLQHYDVPGDEERQRAFHATGVLPPPRAGKREDLNLISEIRRSGRDVGRVHVVDWPLSDYVRYELAVYAENAAAGEDIRIADLGMHPELDGFTTDFAIFDVESDDPSVIIFDYSDSGLIRGYRHSQDPTEIAVYREQYELADRHSIPLHEYLAARRESNAR